MLKHLEATQNYERRQNAKLEKLDDYRSLSSLSMLGDRQKLKLATGLRNSISVSQTTGAVPSVPTPTTRQRLMRGSLE